MASGAKKIELLLKEDELEDVPRQAFRGMLFQIKSGKPLNEKQLKWVDDLFQKFNLIEPAENLWSGGGVPAGKPVPAMDAILATRIPARPPPRPKR